MENPRKTHCPIQEPGFSESMLCSYSPTYIATENSTVRLNMIHVHIYIIYIYICLYVTPPRWTLVL